jgi:iron(III) transport system permease protein
MLRTAFMLGTLYVFVESMTTLSSVIFLVSGGHKLAAVEIFNHANDGDFGFAAAKSLIIFVIALAAISLIWRIDARATRRREATTSRSFAQARPPNDANSGPLRPA